MSNTYVRSELVSSSKINAQGKLLGVSKVQRYKWSPLGDKGTFKWLSKKELQVDHSYQRNKLNELRINQMSSSWDWILCGALSVAIRENAYYVMDGQHRKLAADKRDDIELLPCMIFSTESKPIEAMHFVGLNSQKTSVSGPDRFKAMIAAGDKNAIALKDLITSTGHKVGANSAIKTVSCILCLWKLFNKNAEIITRLWPLLSDMSPSSPIVDTFVRAMYGCELQMVSRKLSLTMEPFRTKLLSIGSPGIIQEVRRQVLIVGKGGQHIETVGAMKFLNRQKMGYKFIIS